jgi:AraC family transcriptional regulator, regulatory protein of adaptative response / methylated-DNA-[protein]-cysteine methyltransferase
MILNKTTQEQSAHFKASHIETPIGQMVAVADANRLYLLEFQDQYRTENELEQLGRKIGSTVMYGITAPLDLITKELNRYFAGTLQIFKTPVFFLGTSFQKLTWDALQEIPYGHTRSYAEIAAQIERPSAFRAVANANSKNKLVIIVPCHRIINADGKLGGYSAGLERKQWLINHERDISLAPF